jgi:hypothetical protein
MKPNIGSREECFTSTVLLMTREPTRRASAGWPPIRSVEAPSLGATVVVALTVAPTAGMFLFGLLPALFGAFELVALAGAVGFAQVALAVPFLTRGGSWPRTRRWLFLVGYPIVSATALAIGIGATILPEIHVG